jgi:putative IMPACT (imprinted ancient) family translation regulator
MPLRSARNTVTAVLGNCGLEADGEEDDLLVRVAARDLQRVERRIDDAHVGRVRFRLEQAFA